MFYNIMIIIGYNSSYDNIVVDCEKKITHTKLPNFEFLK
jgi:hypothetical protein